MATKSRIGATRWAQRIALGVGLLWSASTLLAGRAEELAQIHREAIGGDERLAALKSIRATGLVIAGGKKMRFTMLAARPNLVRLETESGGRTLVQAFDGKEPAWEFDTGTWPPKYHEMAPNVAKTFMADAEFDDPLIGGAARGFTFDYAGEIGSDGKKLLRILVTRNLTETFSVLLDPDTFFIVKRIDQKPNPFGRPTEIVTHFGDYRPVDGVLVPHLVVMAIDGQVKQQTKIEAVEANPDLPEDSYTRPRTVAVPTR